MRSSLYRIENWSELAFAAGFHASELARLVHHSPRQLERFFAAEFGQTPRKWLDGQQMAKAKEWLLARRRIKEAAVALGFSDPSHFSRKFRNYYGQSPAEFIVGRIKGHVGKSPKKSQAGR